MRLDTIKLLEKNTGRILSDINDCNIFFDASPRIREIITKINKWDLLKLQSFCISKETINRTKRQLSEWEKIFATKMKHLTSDRSSKCTNNSISTNQTTQLKNGKNT